MACLVYLFSGANNSHGFRIKKDFKLFYRRPQHISPSFKQFLAAFLLQVLFSAIYFLFPDFWLEKQLQNAISPTPNLEYAKPGSAWMWLRLV
jgi:hypothetical protein